MSQLNMRYLICIICRFVMYVCLFILFINIYNNIDQFRLENKKVRLESLVSNDDYDGGENMMTSEAGDGVPETMLTTGTVINDKEGSAGAASTTKNIVRPQRNNSLYRFDQFYRHYMKYLLDEIDREENE